LAKRFISLIEGNGAWREREGANMKCNVGAVDRVTRGLMGIIIGSGGLMLSMPLFRWPLVSIGTVLLLTAVFAWCPLYYAAGRSTHSNPT
jgi:hypothetical protein